MSVAPFGGLLWLEGGTPFGEVADDNNFDPDYDLFPVIDLIEGPVSERLWGGGFNISVTSPAGLVFREIFGRKVQLSTSVRVGSYKADATGRRYDGVEADPMAEKAGGTSVGWANIDGNSTLTNSAFFLDGDGAWLSSKKNFTEFGGEASFRIPVRSGRRSGSNKHRPDSAGELGVSLGLSVFHFNQETDFYGYEIETAPRREGAINSTGISEELHSTYAGFGGSVDLARPLVGNFDIAFELYGGLYAGFWDYDGKQSTYSVSLGGHRNVQEDDKSINFALEGRARMSLRYSLPVGYFVVSGEGRYLSAVPKIEYLRVGDSTKVGGGATFEESEAAQPLYRPAHLTSTDAYFWNIMLSYTVDF